VRIATWNVNSLKARQEAVDRWLERAQPDILLMQETKLSDEDAPVMPFTMAGYELLHHGEGRWNGVAIASRVGLDDPVSGFGDGGPPDDEARLVSATCDGVRVSSVYVPNGREVGHEQFHHKLRWLARLRAHVEAESGRHGAGAGIAVCGDFNVAPEDIDVWNPNAVHGATHVTPEERAALGELEAFGLRDAFREQYPGEPNLFSWWDYRAGAFHKHQGMRIDLMMLSSELADRVTWAFIDRNARKGHKPSDHAPQFVDVV
jgi:exodeoxyribonuclease-3